MIICVAINSFLITCYGNYNQRVVIALLLGFRSKAETYHLAYDYHSVCPLSTVFDFDYFVQNLSNNQK